VLPSELERVRIQTGAVIISPETSGSNEPIRNSGSEADIAENLDLQFKAGATPNKEKDFASFKRRQSKKEFYSKRTLDKYASELERDILKLIESKNLSKNENLQNELLNDVLRRLGNRVGRNESSDTSSKILSNMRDLIKDMREHGINDMEQIRFLEGIALAVSSDISNAKIVKVTGLSKRCVECGIKLRKEFNKVSEKARAEISCVNDGANSDEGVRERQDWENAVNDYEIESISNSGDRQEGENDVNENVSNNSERDTVYSEDTAQSVHSDNNRVRKRAKRGEGKKRTKTNRYRPYISRKFREKRRDEITGVEMQRFMHGSPWGWRIVTHKISKHQILVEQPLGGFEYESVRSYQYSVKEMYHHFKLSEYGVRQRAAHNNRDLSLRKFRELICPCMTLAKQRDTADEIVAEFKHCLLTWDTNMRKKDSNVKASIEKCKNTECAQHKRGSNSAELYAVASKSPSHFMKYLMCPQIQRDELAVKVADGNSNYAAKLAASKAANIAAAVTAKAKKEEDYWASGAKRGKYIGV
jgi:hypothetical protein